MYQNHSGILEKIYLRHNENSEKIATKTLESGTEAFSILNAPWKFLSSLFSSTGSSSDKAKEEKEARKKVEEAEPDINKEPNQSDDADKKKKNTPELI